jgi:hypothetical protein
VYDIIFPGIELLFVRRMCSLLPGAHLLFSYVRSLAEESCSKSRGLEAPVLSHYVYVHYMLCVCIVYIHTKHWGYFLKGRKRVERWGSSITCSKLMVSTKD